MTPLNALTWIFPLSHGAHPTAFDRAFARVYYSHPLTWRWRLPPNMRCLLEPWPLIAWFTQTVNSLYGEYRDDIVEEYRP